MKTNKLIVFILAAIVISQLTFLLLKAFNKISWSWLWVMSPLWIPYVLVLSCGLFVILYFIYLNTSDKIKRK